MTAADVQDAKGIGRINAQLQRLSARIRDMEASILGKPRQKGTRPTPEPLSLEQEENLQARGQLEQEFTSLSNELRMIHDGTKYASPQRQRDLVYGYCC
jgi:hypothetical protein